LVRSVTFWRGGCSGTGIVGTGIVNVS
jgi:hypothetical protein